VARASRLAPFAPPDEAGAGPGAPAHPLWRLAVAAGGVCGLAGLLVPPAPLPPLRPGIALAVGSLLAWQPRGAARMLTVAAGGAVLGGLLHLPVAREVVTSRAEVAAWLGSATPRGLDLPEILRFQTGPSGDGPVGWALLGAAALPLLVGGAWRLRWAIRGW